MAEVGRELSLITAGTPERFNSLTARYGAVGMIWMKDSYFAFIKPERYTWEFIRDQEYFTVSYFPKEYDGIHQVFGHQSGRDVDKAQLTGITPEFLPHGVTYREAYEVYVCRKMYMRQMDRALIPEDAIAKYEDPTNLLYGETHYVVIGEIVEHIVRGER